MAKKKRKIWIAVILAVLAALPFVVSQYMVAATADNIMAKADEHSTIQNSGLTEDELKALKSVGAECILILGAGLKADGTPNHMLQDRLNVGIALYNEGVAPKLLLTGDNGQEEYDEVNAMKKCVLEAGVPLEDIFLDHAGFSTYDSMYRAKEIFQVEKSIVITQTYHQYRALYIAESLGMEAYGVSSDQRTYVGQSTREMREILARDKDFLKSIIKSKPKYSGDAIPISGNGIESHD